MRVVAHATCQWKRERQTERETERDRERERGKKTSALISECSSRITVAHLVAAA